MTEYVEKSKAELIFEGHLSHLEKIWIRPLGFSLGALPFRRIEKLPIAEQLFAALLSLQKEKAEKLIKEASISDWTQFTLLVTKTHFARLIIDNACELRLIGELPPECRSELMRFSMRETTDQRVSETAFNRILKGLASYAVPLVWIKGASLSRVDYAEAHHRQYSDLDLVVHPNYLVDVYNDFEKLGYSRVYDAGFCNQFGVGPVDHVAQLTLVPSSEFAPSSALTLQQLDWPMMDIKVSPYDQGIHGPDADGFFARAEAHKLREGQFYAPNTVDHLLISLHTLFKDRFTNWKTLFDIHILCIKLNAMTDGWAEFIRLCHRECKQSAAWAGLVMAVDRFSAPVPNAVLIQLAPLEGKTLEALHFAVSPYFVWNATSLPMMVLNAFSSEDKERKLPLIKQAVFPSRIFLTRYYARGNWQAKTTWLYLLHWLVLALPGGMVRVLFGSWMWPLRREAGQEQELGEPVRATESAVSFVQTESAVS